MLSFRQLNIDNCEVIEVIFDNSNSLSFQEIIGKPHS